MATGTKEAGITGKPKQAAPAASGLQQVTIKKSVRDRIQTLNSTGELQQELRLSAVARPLSRLDEKVALSVLNTLHEAAASVEDPIAFVREKVAVAERKAAAADAKAKGAHKGQKEIKKDERGKLPESIKVGSGKAMGKGNGKPRKLQRADGEAASAGAEGEAEAQESEAPGESEVVKKETVKQRVERLNQSGLLAENLPLKLMREFEKMVGSKVLFSILRDLEGRAAEIEIPFTWVRAQVRRRCGKVLVHVDELNRGGPGKMDLLAPIEIDAVREPLALIPEAVAFQILQELEARIMEIKDPTSWIIEKARRKVGVVAARLQELNDSGKLVEALPSSWSLAVLSQLDEKNAIGVLKDLEQNGAKIRNPMGWLRSSIIKRMEKGAKATGPDVEDEDEWDDQGSAARAAVQRPGSVRPVTPEKKRRAAGDAGGAEGSAANKRSRLGAAAGAAGSSASAKVVEETAEEAKQEEAEAEEEEDEDLEAQEAAALAAMRAAFEEDEGEVDAA
mmetsp:Transcript_43139/g.91970  ORF Transcript_43139/g.91970 Transcript_43139/m.91970 type:complete len:507 (-) Transcript_43139:108-1628(-)